MDIDIVIPHKNQIEFLVNTIESIKLQLQEVNPIVVDDDSDDLTIGRLRKIKGINLICTKDLNSPYKARNIGMSQGVKNNVLLLDSKSKLSIDYFKTVNNLLTVSDWDIVAGKINVTGINENSHPIEQFYALYYLKTDPIFYNGIASPLTTNMLVKRSCFDDLKGFKSSRSGNDTDFAQRARERGCKILYASSLKINYKNKSKEEVLSFLRRIAKNKNHVMNLIDARPPRPKDLNFRLNYIGLNLSGTRYVRLYVYVWLMRIYLYSHKTVF